MILTLLLLAAQQGVLQGDLLDNPKLPIEAYELPELGGQREIILGIKPKDNELYGYYAQYGETFNNLGNMRLRNPDYYVDYQVGYMGWSVALYPHDGEKDFLLQTDGLYKQTAHLTKTNVLNFSNKAKHSYWISPDGRILQENWVISVSAGTWTTQAVYHNDSYDLDISDPMKGEKKSSIVPGCGIDKLNAKFEPMIKDDKVILPDKEYYELNPLTGAPVKCEIKQGPDWKATMFDTKYQGHTFDLDEGGRKEKIFLSSDGVLFRVETPNHHYLGIQTKPGDNGPAKIVH